MSPQWVAPRADALGPAGPLDAGGKIGHLADNVMHFARVLRAAGMPVGTDRIAAALQALEAGGLEQREDFRAALAACLIGRHEHRALFDQAFELFWRDPDLAGRMMAMLLPRVRAARRAAAAGQNRRLADALYPLPDLKAPPAPPPKEDALQIEADLTWSEREALHRADFESMSADEWRAAKRALATWQWQLRPVPTRRMAAAARPGRLDLRATLRAAARQGGEIATLHWRRPREIVPPWVVLADISGSMSRYSRMLLHFAHALQGARGAGASARVHSFVFGTRLTPITHALRERDPDEAVAAAVQAAADWSGGTRLTACLHEFNRHWARRVLSGRATLLLITDGLEHGDTEALAVEMARLRGRCRRLVWLNPLLRYDGFEPRAAGIRAMLPHVDEFIPAHNLDSLAALAATLATPRSPRRG